MTKKYSHNQFIVEQLEPRLLFSADFQPVPFDGGFQEETILIGSSVEETPLVPAAAEARDSVNEEHQRREIIFIDASIPDYQQLVDDLLDGNDYGRKIEVVVLDISRDGIMQISETLGRFQDLDAVHVVSHGTDGAVQLGNSMITLDTIDAYVESIAGWQDALTSKADLLFYGCDLAAGEDGQSLMQSLTFLTGADVAASTDATGQTLRDGNWILEYSSGNIESEVAFSAYIQENWNGRLAVIPVTNTAASGVGSLEQAILDSNASIGVKDTITFQIGGGGLQTIVVAAAGLPWITDSVILDATTQTGYSGTPLIELDGSLTGGTVNGIGIRANDSVVKGFIVHSFGDEGIEIVGNTGFGDNNTVQNCWLGIDSTGSAAPNADNGIILAFGASGNLIGGSGLNEGNVVSGNTTTGIILRDAGTDNNTIQGNLIGVAPDGFTAVQNGYHGIELSTAVANNIIGGTNDGEGNTIANNTQHGISVNSDAGTGNIIRGNTVLDNSLNGVYSSADDVLIVNNVIWSNGSSHDGILIAAGGTNNKIYHNTIHGNTDDGIEVGDTGSIIRNNIITGNSGYGINRVAASMTESYNLVTEPGDRRIDQPCQYIRAKQCRAGRF
jgi:parallel beta-helix repeat protein